MLVSVDLYTVPILKIIFTTKIMNFLFYLVITNYDTLLTLDKSFNIYL